MFRKLETGPDGVILPFSTAKYKYNIIRPGEPMGISRWTEYTKLSIVLGTGKTLSAVVDAFEEIEKTAAHDRPFPDVRRDIILLANSNRRAILELSKARFDYGMYQASLFIVREGDERKDWTIDLANDYIQDWKDDGINEQDLFFFATKTAVGLKRLVRKLQEEAQRQTGELSAISGPTQPDTETFLRRSTKI